MLWKSAVSVGRFERDNGSAARTNDFNAATQFAECEFYRQVDAAKNLILRTLKPFYRRRRSPIYLVPVPDEQPNLH